MKYLDSTFFGGGGRRDVEGNERRQGEVVYALLSSRLSLYTSLLFFSLCLVLSFCFSCVVVDSKSVCVCV